MIAEEKKKSHCKLTVKLTFHCCFPLHWSREVETSAAREIAQIQMKSERSINTIIWDLLHQTSN